MTDKDELFKGIDEAANNLFDQYIVKKPEPAESEDSSPDGAINLEAEQSQDEILSGSDTCMHNCKVIFH